MAGLYSRPNRKKKSSQIICRDTFFDVSQTVDVSTNFRQEHEVALSGTRPQEGDAEPRRAGLTAGNVARWHGEGFVRGGAGQRGAG